MDKKKGRNSDYLLQANRSLVLQILARNDVCTRARIAEETGLKQATITNIITEMIQAGVVREVGIVEGKRGRRSIGIELAAEKIEVIAVKLGHVSYSVGLFDLKGTMLKLYESRFGTEEENDPHKALAKIKKTIWKYLNQEGDKVHAIGIAVPGPFLKHSGTIALMTQFPGWDRLNLNEEFLEEFPVPVLIEHGANAGALAEWRYGKYRRNQGVLVNFLAGEGIGAGIVADGQLFVGSRGIAGEIGHISLDVNGEKCDCGNRGCMELYCSALSFVKYAMHKLPEHKESILNQKSNITYLDIFKGAEDGDKFCLDMVKRAGFYMGCGIAAVINIYDPDVIIISDAMSKGGDLLLEEIRRTVRERILDVLYENIVIDYTDFSVNQILYGAAVVAIDHLLNSMNMLMHTQTPDSEAGCTRKKTM
ncbi:ROK family transcriptional regulator [Clostridium sp. AM58-1XD]|uniref:ROK family transcriptional regulator n=1 Tax=Clostridium sp. AM58-1XD TaxID=2292307 RepID=UPI000E49C6EC|nr:ROK family transcriptional regulator [Clostridium sp. AM58-1XD]RGZ00115.1 ROK family transcriptional regulator [Clostridium sp. AM58-1XD]